MSETETKIGEIDTKNITPPYIEDKYACLVDLSQTNNLINQNIDSKEEPIDPVAEFNDLFNTLEKISGGSIFFSNQKGESLELGRGVSVSHTNSDKQLYLINNDTGEQIFIAYHPENNQFYRNNEGLYSEEGVYSEEKVQEILGSFRNIINVHPQTKPINENQIDNQINEENEINRETTQNHEENIDSKEKPIDPVAEFNDLFNTLEKISQDHIETILGGHRIFNGTIDLEGRRISRTNSDKQLFLQNGATTFLIAYHPETNQFYQANCGLYSEERVYSEEKVQEILRSFRNIINKLSPTESIDKNQIDNQTNEGKRINGETTQNQEQNIDSKEEPIDPVTEFNDLYNTLKGIHGGFIVFSNGKGESFEVGHCEISHTNSDKQLYLTNTNTGEKIFIAYHPETNQFYQNNEGLYSEEGVYSEEKVQEILESFRNIKDPNNEVIMLEGSETIRCTLEDMEISYQEKMERDYQKHMNNNKTYEENMGNHTNNTEDIKEYGLIKEDGLDRMGEIHSSFDELRNEIGDGITFDGITILQKQGSISIIKQRPKSTQYHLIQQNDKYIVETVDPYGKKETLDLTDHSQEIEEHIQLIFDRIDDLQYRIEKRQQREAKKQERKFQRKNRKAQKYVSIDQKQWEQYV